MSFVRSLLYTLVFYPLSVFFVLATIAAIPFGHRAILVGPRSWSHFHHFCARWILGIRVRVEGQLPPTGVIAAFKHESFFETAEILRLFDDPAVVFKAELMKIPLWGMAARAHGVIPVERDAGATALRQMLKAAKKAVADGRPILIFPEGTRVPHGERPALRPGIAGLYKSLGLPMVPIALDSGCVWPRRSFVKKPGVITFKVGEIIPAGLPREEIEERIHAAINALND